MKPAPFEYFAPPSVEQALALLAEHGYEAKVLAGGQSLVIKRLHASLGLTSIYVTHDQVEALSLPTG